MKTFEQLAKEGFSEFQRQRKKDGSRGTDRVRWENLSVEQQWAWIAATRHIVEQANQVH